MRWRNTRAGGGRASSVPGYLLQGGTPWYHYKLNDASSPAVDSGSFGVDLAESGSVLWGQDSPLTGDTGVKVNDGGVLNFPQSTVGSNAWGTNDFEFVFWLKGAAGTATDKGIFYFGGATAKFEMYYQLTTNLLVFRCIDDAAAVYNVWFAQADVWDKGSEWAELYGVVDRSETHLVLYRNGVELSRAGNTGTLSAMGGNITIDDRIRIGALANAAERWEGNAAELWVHSGLDNYNGNF